MLSETVSDLAENRSETRVGDNMNTEYNCNTGAFVDLNSIELG